MENLNANNLQVVEARKRVSVWDFLKANWFPILALIYILSPIDILPDWIPFIGQVDDTMVVLGEIVRRYFEFKKMRSGQR